MKLLNQIILISLSSLDSEMKNYLISLAKELIINWDKSEIRGNGKTQMEFRLNANGTLDGKKIYKYSGNKKLDSSVEMLISTFNQFQSPPSSYKGEIIYG